MGEMKWTTEKPTVHGRYWRKIGPQYKEIVHVFHFSIGTGPIYLGFDGNGDYPIRVDLSGDDKWAGPIPEPED